MTLTRYGLREWLGGGGIALGLFSLGLFFGLHGNIAGWFLAAVAGLGWLALAAFFRVPHRTIPSDPTTLLSPADGVVKDIETLCDHDIEPFAGQPLVRIGIFLSVLDVHVNRAPADMNVTWRRYKKGRYLDARNPRCAKENESLTIAGFASLDRERIPLAVRQISGAIARRIVCEAEPGAALQRGAIYGMIKFGSRTELYFPAEPHIQPTVQLGDTVRSGTTVLARKIQEAPAP